MKLLIVEGNPRHLIAKGYPAYAQHFKTTLGVLDPTIDFAFAEPFEARIEPHHLDDIDGAVFTGSSTEAATNSIEYAPQRTAMEFIFAHGKPVWGSCAGLQLAATILGGNVGPSPLGVEVGLARQLTLTTAGRSHAMMTGRPIANFTAPCIHRDEVHSLPEGAELLAHNDHCRVQAFAYHVGDVTFWGTQYHPELEPQVIAAVLRQDRTHMHVRSALELADRCKTSAAKLGSRPQALRLPERATELSNWLAHITQLKSNSDSYPHRKHAENFPHSTVPCHHPVPPEPVHQASTLLDL